MFSTNKNRKNVVGKKSFSVAFRPLSLESSMADNSRAAFLQARQCWPDRGRDELIPATAKSIYEAWQAVSPDARRLAIDAAVASGLTRAPGKDTERAQCRDLTLFGSPLPGPQSALRPLTTAQVVALGVVPPSTTRPRRRTTGPVFIRTPAPTPGSGAGDDSRGRGGRPEESGPPSFAGWGGIAGKTAARGAREPLSSPSFALPLPFVGARIGYGFPPSPPGHGSAGGGTGANARGPGRAH
jgi:hypothetical protein